MGVLVANRPKIATPACAKTRPARIWQKAALVQISAAFSRILNFRKRKNYNT